jgi:hypothetical protein
MSLDKTKPRLNTNIKRVQNIERAKPAEPHFHPVELQHPEELFKPSCTNS